MDRDDRRSSFLAYMIVIEFTGLLFSGCMANPQFNSKPSYAELHENSSTPIGKCLFNLTATDVEHPSNTMTIYANDANTNMYVSVTQTEYTSPVLAAVYLKKLLDRESTDGVIELNFFLNDSIGNTIHKSVKLYIIDECDEPPQYDRPSYTLEINEVNITSEKLVFGEIHATDRDNGNYAVVTYTMESKDYWTKIYNETFRMDPANGNVYLMKSLDYENNSFYQFTLYAHDTCGLKAVPANLTIKVKDVQDKPPFFIGLPYMRNIPEGMYDHYQILTVEAFDGDIGIPNKVNYSLVYTNECLENNNSGCVFCNKLFAINSLTGDITINGSLDWEMQDVLDIYGICNIAVKVTEITQGNINQTGDIQSRTNITVKIVDENNHSPTFETKIYKAKIQENARKNTPVLLIGNETDINISDKDQGIYSKFTATLSCENDSHCQTFEVVPANAIFREGVVTIRVNNNSLLDYEERHNMTITVTAKEMENSSHTDTAIVIVEIENVNEFPPEFANVTYVACIPEGVANGTDVINITATDNDTDIYGYVTYSLSGGNNLFSIHNETGQVVTNCKTSQLDREELPRIYLTIIARDGGGVMTQAQLIINLNDVNDNPPVFQQKIYSAFLEENSTEYKNKSFLTVKATDADQSGTKNSEISYTLGNATWNSNFTINNTTGEIRLLFPLDYEALKETDHGVINLTVFANDHGTPGPMRGNVTVTILVQDMNDNAPVFVRMNYTGTIKENATSGTWVGMVSATDADKTGRNNKTSFAIESGGFDNFRINSTTGDVTVQVGAHFDRDNINLYNLTIIAIDQGSNSFTTTTTMTVTITDVNNKPPKFNQNSYSISKLENMTLGYNFTSCIATDLDQNHQLNYSINHTMGWDENGREVNQSDIETYFRIKDGNVYVNANLDRETVERLEVTIVVHDTKEEENMPQTATTTLTVTLLDVNDNDPYFISGNRGHVHFYETNVSENANNPTILMSVSATDTDKNRTITYEIIHSTLNADLNKTAFRIDPKTGELSKIGPVDREVTPTVNLTVIAIDNGYPSRNSSVTLLITILDFNDNTPQFLDHNYTYSVPENVKSTIIETISATDADHGENAEVEYEIENVQNLPFQINNKTGTIWVSGNIDRENVSEYRLTILAKDNPKDSKLQRTNRTSIRIVVTDVNDNDPKISNLILTTRTPENTVVKTVIFTVTATDADEGHNANVTFSIVNETNVGGLFDISNTGRNEGRVVIAKSLDDSEEWRNITLIATDHGTPPRSSNATLHISVLDVNLQAPKLGYVQETIKVFECAFIGTEIFRINATDSDKTSPNKDVHFNMSIIQPQNNKDIQINKISGQVLVAANLSIAHISSYKVQVMAVDQGTPNLTSSVKVIDIWVEDVNDQPPSFVNSWFNFSVDEEQSNKPINQVVAFDPDKNSNSCYTLKDLSGYSEYFTINNAGYILVKEPLDRENESQQIITFEVKVYDCTEVVNVSEQCGNSYQLKYNSSAIAKVTITVLDIDDNRPEFTKKNLRAGIRTKSEPGKEILELKSQSYISDKDLPQNAINKWFFEKVSLTMEPKLASVLNSQKTGEVCKEMLCVTGNGTIVNNMWYTQDMSGFFNLSVRVNDSAGNDTTYILIFLIADSQVLKMTLLGNRTAIFAAKNDILSECSNKTGLPFVYDSIADHIADDGSVESFKTDLFFHIDDPVNNRVLSAEEAKRLLDTYADKLIDVRINRNIISIESSLKSVLPGNESTKTIYVLAAVIGLLALVILIVGYMFFSSSNRYKRKLRAAMPMEKEMNVLTNTVSAVPGSNIYASSVNPLLKAGPEPPEYREIDATSHNSLDENEVDDAKKELPKYELEEREITLDMYAEDFNSTPAIDPLEAALREHDVQMKAAMSKQDASSESVNYGFLHQLDLETTEI